MEPETLKDNDNKHAVHHHKPRHIAERLEKYVGVGIVAAAAVILIVLLYSFMQTGSATPSWMQ